MPNQVPTLRDLKNPDVLLVVAYEDDVAGAAEALLAVLARTHSVDADLPEQATTENDAIELDLGAA